MTLVHTEPLASPFYGTFSNSAYVWSIIKVDFIEPDPMTDLEEIDDGDGDPKTRVFGVPIAEAMEYPVVPVTVRATLSPDLSESEVPNGWTLQGGLGSDKLTRTVSRTISAGPSKTEFTFSCGGSDSGYRTTVYVYEARVGQFADEDPLPVGHSWAQYSLDENTEELVDEELRDYIDYLGFWPSISEFPENTECVGDVRLGYGAIGVHFPSGEKEYPILFSALSSALPVVKASDDSPPWYSLVNYNCTDYAIEVGELVYIYTMDTSGFTTPYDFSIWLNTN